MSPYHRLRQDAAYPATLLTATYDESGAGPWQAGKMTAALQAAAAHVPGGGRPVLLRVAFPAREGDAPFRWNPGGPQADVFAFALWQLGDPAFQPVAR